MKYRKLGRTGVNVSEIGVGGHREGAERLSGLACTARFFRSAQDRAAVIAAAIDRGVTYFDSTYGCEIQSLGQSLRLLKKRDGLFCSAMRVDFFANWLRQRTDVRRFLRQEVEGRLRDFGFDSVDQFLLGALDGGDPLAHPSSILEDTIAEFAALRDQGKVRFLGFSCHSPDYAARLLTTFPDFDTVMVPYNYVNRAAEGQLAQAITATGAALVAMKPLVWHVYGLPVTVLRNLPPVPGRLALDPSAPIGRLALQFVLTNPLVSTTVPAVNSLAAVAENVAASDAPALTRTDNDLLASYAQAMAAEDFIPLAIAGLLEDNLRVRSNAIGLLRRRLDYPAPSIDWLSDTAEHEAAQVAQSMLHRLRQDPHWAPYLPAHSDPA